MESWKECISSLLIRERHDTTGGWEEGLGQVPQGTGASENGESEPSFDHVKVTCHLCLHLVPPSLAWW